MRLIVPISCATPRIYLSHGEFRPRFYAAVCELRRCYRIGVLNPPETPWLSSWKARFRVGFRGVTSFVTARLV